MESAVASYDSTPKIGRANQLNDFVGSPPLPWAVCAAPVGGARPRCPFTQGGCPSQSCSRRRLPPSDPVGLCCAGLCALIGRASGLVGPLSTSPSFASEEPFAALFAISPPRGGQLANILKLLLLFICQICFLAPYGPAGRFPTPQCFPE